MGVILPRRAGPRLARGGDRGARAPRATARRRRRAARGVIADVQARGDEPVLQDLARSAEGLAARVRAQDDQEEALPGPPGGDCEVVTRLVGEAGLERLHPARVVEERDAARVDPPAEHEGLAA